MEFECTSSSTVLVLPSTYICTTVVVLLALFNEHLSFSVSESGTNTLNRTILTPEKQLFFTLVPSICDTDVGCEGISYSLRKRRNHFSSRRGLLKTSKTNIMF